MRWALASLIFAACESSSGAGSPDLAGFCTDTNAGVCPVTVSGKVIDESGAPVNQLLLSVCADGCFFGMTAADGRFSIVPDQHIVLANYALELHGRPDNASYYTPLPQANGLQLAFAAPLTLPRLPADGPEIAADTSVTSGEVTIHIPAGTNVLFDVEDFGTPNGHQLRTKKIPTPFLGLDFDALYACSPFEAGFSQKVGLTIANPGLPANAAVEILTMQGLINDQPPAGRFLHAANAHVSADGATVSTDAGEGVTELTWLALKKM